MPWSRSEEAENARCKHPPVSMSRLPSTRGSSEQGPPSPNEVFLSRLDEQQQRWFAALEAIANGAWRQPRLSSLRASMSRPSAEAAGIGDFLARRASGTGPAGRGGRPPVEKKMRLCRRTCGPVGRRKAGGDPMKQQKWVRLSLESLKANSWPSRDTPLTQRPFAACSANWTIR